MNADLLTAYLAAMRYLSDEGDKVFFKYQSRYGLTVKEAENLLKRARNKHSLEVLIRALEKDPKNTRLIMELEAGAYGARLRRIAYFMEEIDKVAAALAKRTEGGLEKLLPEIAKDSYYRTIFNVQQETGYYNPFKTLGEEKVNEILHRKWQGSDFSKRIWKNGEELAESLKDEVMINLLTGRSLHKATVALQKKMESGYSDTKRVVRTESTYVSNELQAKGYEETGVERYIYVAILDLRTSKICRSLDKKVFKLKDRKVGTNYPPMHPNCRSTTISWVPPELLKKMKQRALDPKTGKRIIVPGDMTYQEWYDKYVKGAKGESKSD